MTDPNDRPSEHNRQQGGAMEQDKQRQQGQDSQQKQTPGHLVGNFQESGRQQGGAPNDNRQQSQSAVSGARQKDQRSGSESQYGNTDEQDIDRGPSDPSHR